MVHVIQFDVGRVQQLPNSGVKLIFGLRKYGGVGRALDELGWLTICNRRYLHTASTFYKINNPKTPPYLCSKIKHRNNVHNTNVRFKGALTPDT